MIKGTPKDLTVIIKKAKKQGWEVTKRRASHLKWVAPDGSCIFTSSTPSDRRAMMNIVGDLRKHGFIETSK